MNIIPKKSNKYCGAIWQRMSIRANGDMYACCHQNYELLIGNINDMTIHKAWNSDFMNGLRKLHAGFAFVELPQSKSFASRPSDNL